MTPPPLLPLLYLLSFPLQVARCKRNLLRRAKLVSSDCTLPRAPRLGELYASEFGPGFIPEHEGEEEKKMMEY